MAICVPDLGIRSVLPCSLYGGGPLKIIFQTMDPTPTIPALNLFNLNGQNALITGASRGTFSSQSLSFYYNTPIQA